MFIMVICLVGASMYLEYYIVRRYPAFRRFLERKGLRTLVFSLSLSWLLGAIFGAAGMIVMAAGLISTCVMQPIYRMWSVIDRIKLRLRRR